MFFRLALTCLLLTVVISASPLNFGADVDKIPNDIKALIPMVVVDFYKGLTAEDKVVIQELANKAKAREIKTEEEAIEALKARSESLYTKAKVIYDLVAAKVNALDTEAKTFIVQTIAAARALRPEPEEPVNIPKVKETVRNVIKNYLNLSEAAKDDLQGQFPQIIKLANHPAIKAIADKTIKN